MINAGAGHPASDARRFESLVLADEVLSDLGVPGLRALVMNTSRDPNAKVTSLLFSPGRPHPILVIKVPTTDAAQLAVLRERRLLVHLHGMDLGPLRPTVPRAVRMLEVHGRQALLMTATPGSSMLSRYHRWRHTATADAVRADFTRVEAWLAILQSRTATSVRPMDLGAELPEALMRRFPDQPAITETARRLTRILEALASSRTALTAVHGDFWIGNLLMGDGAVTGVVDWEAGAVADEPVRDLVRFALTYALYLDRHSGPGAQVVGHPGLVSGAWGSGVRYALDSDGWFPELFRGFLREGLARLGATPAHWRLAAMAGIAEVAATTDHHDFALQHLELFQSLAVDA